MILRLIDHKSQKSEKFKLTWEVLLDISTILNIANTIDVNSLYTDFSCFKTIFGVCTYIKKWNLGSFL